MSAVRVGMITPSSNTCLERVAYSLLQGVAEVTVHFARVLVIRDQAGRTASASDG